MRMTEDEYAALMARRIPRNTAPLSSKPVRLKAAEKERGYHAPPKAKQPNKTEAEYGRMLGMEFPGALIAFEGFSFRMSNGHRYTPDWVVCDNDLLLCVEVKARGKNGFRHPSYQRARLAFDQCRHDYPAIQWRWAEKHCGRWEV